MISQSENAQSATTRENGKPAEGKQRRKSRSGQATSKHSEGSPAEARSRQLLSAIMAFRDGDFSVRLPADWAGTDGRIAEAFNHVIAHEDRIAQEVTRLSMTVGK